MQNIVITGCSRGIGHAIATKFLETGNYYVIGTSTSGQSPLQHDNFMCYPLSLNNENSITNFATILNKNYSQIHGLINNAAILLEDETNTKINMNKLESTFSVNLFGTINLTEQLLELFSDNGRIINISSNWGSFSDPNFSAFHPHYKMSKAALNMYSKLLAERLLAQKIIIAAYEPGWVKTDMGGMNAARDPLDVGQDILELFKKDISSGYFWQSQGARDW